MTNSQHVYEVRPRKDHRGVNLISDALPFGALWYAEPNAISNAIGYAKFYSRSRPLYVRQNSSSGTVRARSNPYAVQNCFVDSVPFVLTSSHPQSTPGHFATKFRIARPRSKRKNQKSQVNKLAVFTQNIRKFIRPNIG
jgi:hypothetical protein